MSSPNIRQKSPVPRISPSGGGHLARQPSLTAASAASRLDDATSTASLRRFNFTVFGVLGIIAFIYTTVILCVVRPSPKSLMMLLQISPLTLVVQEYHNVFGGGSAVQMSGSPNEHSREDCMETSAGGHGCKIWVFTFL